MMMMMMNDDDKNLDRWHKKSGKGLKVSTGLNALG